MLLSLDLQFVGDGGRVAVCGARAQGDAVRGAPAVLADGAPDPPVAEGGQVVITGTALLTTRRAWSAVRSGRSPLWGTCPPRRKT